MKRRFLFLLLASIVACQVVASIDYVEKQERTGDGGRLPDGAPIPPGGDGSTGIPPNDPCKHASAPTAPDKDDNPDLKLPPFYLAVRTMNPTSLPNVAFGIDLDNICTCDGRSGTAADGGSSCTNAKAKPKDLCDDNDGGIDNHGAVLLGTYDTPEFSLAAGATDDIASGSRTILIYVAEYNGLANDAVVRIGVVMSGNDNTVPVWDGKDKWNFESASIDGLSGAPLALAVGHVTNNVLVYKREDGVIPMIFGKATLSFGTPTMLGKLEKAGDRWELKDGILAGRLRAFDLNAGIGQLKDPLNRPNGRMCENSFLFETIRTDVCSRLDIMNVAVEDRKGRPCDALSDAVAFTAVQAELGTEVPPGNEDNPCLPSKVDKTLYECP